MKPTKKLKIRFYVAMIALLVVSSVGVGLGVKAYQNNSQEAPKYVIENMSGNITEAPEVTPLSVDTIVTDGEAIMGASPRNSAVSDLEDNNGDVVYHKVQTFQTGTTTLISIPTPFLSVSSTSSAAPVVRTDGTVQYVGATTTVDLARFYVTGVATSSMVVKCGAAANPTAAPTMLLLDSGTIGTSTKATIENGITTAQGAGVSGSSTQKIMMSSAYPYFTCTVTTADYTDTSPLTQSSRTLAGYALVRFSRLRF